jgi:hypothetical protein
MTWWKVSYDVARPNWTAFGRIAFVRADTHDEAVESARVLISDTEQQGATVTRLEVVPSTIGAMCRVDAQHAAVNRWMANNAAGIPNRRGDL